MKHIEIQVESFDNQTEGFEIKIGSFGIKMDEFGIWDSIKSKVVKIKRNAFLSSNEKLETKMTNFEIRAASQ